MKKKVVLIIFVLAALFITTGNTALGKPLAKEMHFITIAIYKDDSVTASDSYLRGLVDDAMFAIASAAQDASGGTHVIYWNFTGPKENSKVQLTLDDDGCADGFPISKMPKNSIFFTEGRLHENGSATQKGGKAFVDLALSPTCAPGKHQYDDTVATTHELGHTFDADHEDHGTCTDEYNTKELFWTIDGCGSEGVWELSTFDSMEKHDMLNGYVGFAEVNADRIYDYINDNY